MRRKLMRVWVLTSAICLSGQASQAATITFTDTVSTIYAPNTITLSVPQFDPSLGMLQSVLIEYSADIEGSFESTNLGGSAGQISGSYTAQFTLDGPGFLGTLLTLTPSADIAPPIPVGAGETVGPFPLGSSDADSFLTTDALELALFIGLGTVSFPGTASVLTLPVTNFAPFVVAGDIAGIADVAVTYEFDGAVIPEPHTLALLGTGLLFIGRRVRKKRAQP